MPFLLHSRAHERAEISRNSLAVTRYLAFIKDSAFGAIP